MMTTIRVIDRQTREPIPYAHLTYLTQTAIADGRGEAVLDLPTLPLTLSIRRNGSYLAAFVIPRKGEVLTVKI